ncbi:hypothetical protein [Virgibacillus halodenitrificans]|uniref:hypothetical protein n=1 Tax=Virgibacillus halodenitrificans TaxID=1482 RepID=UPI000EF487C3|nr:hypothetical protein [Virgibacillus halodenitrificans]
MNNEKEVKVYEQSLKDRIINLKELGYSERYIHEKLSSELGIIISIFAARNPNMKLKDMEPIIKVFTSFQSQYLNNENR